MLDCTSADALWLASLRAGGRSKATLYAYSYALRQLREWRENVGRSAHNVSTSGHISEAENNVCRSAHISEAENVSSSGHVSESRPPVADLLTVTRLEAMSFARYLTDTYAPQGNISRIKSLKVFYNWAVEEELIAVSPFAKVKMSAPAIAKPVPSNEEVAAMFERARKTTNARRDTALLSVLVCTGARKGELANVEVSDVDLHSGVLRLRVSKSRARTVPLDDRAVVALGRWMRQRGVGSGSLWSSGDPYQLIDNVMLRLSAGQWRSHAMRRYMATTWLRKGGSEVSLIRICGWSSGAMLRHYVSASADTIALEEFRRLMA